MTTPKDAYDRDYKKANYDNILVRVKKGKREEYRQAAENFGLGQVEMIRLAVEKFIAERSGEPFTKPEKPESLSAADKKLVENFNALSPKSQKALREIISELVTKGSGEND